jgi:iron complex transport system ATP-binding protein
MAADLLAVSRLEAGYGKGPVLRDLDLRLAPGSFTALIGPNGGGKSTLLRTICRLVRPSAGDILLDGRSLRSLPQAEVARLVGYVPQATPLDFGFTVEEVVLMGRYPHLRGLQRPGREDVSLAQAAMDATGVTALRHRLVGELSGGEGQRTLIARCLAQNPRLFLLDEPTAHLDLAYQVEILSLLAELNRREGLSILAVLHDLNLAAQFFDRFVLVHEGQVLADGSADAVLLPEILGQAYDARIDVVRDTGGKVIRVLAEPARAAR